MTGCEDVRSERSYVVEQTPYASHKSSLCRHVSSTSNFYILESTYVIQAHNWEFTVSVSPFTKRSNTD